MPIPDCLYEEAKRISREYEMSFAEVVRRGLERIVPFYPPRAAQGGMVNSRVAGSGLSGSDGGAVAGSGAR